MKALLSLTFTIASALAVAQNSTDALRYSRMEHQGSARFTSMGGSFGALGGEISGIIINPAGVGVYRNSEFTFSSGFNIIDTETNYLGENRSDGRVNFNLPNIGYVGSYRGDKDGWKNYSFAINHNRVSSFNNENRLLGNTLNSSIINDYVDFLNNEGASINATNDFQYPFGPSEAWNILMIDSTLDANDRVIYQPFVFAQDNTEHSRSKEVRGSQSETSFAFGGNYRDRLYLGGSIGFQRVRYDQEVTYSEKYSYNGSIDETQYFGTNYNEQYSLLALGSGVNFKLGAIYRINDIVRVGGAIHSPTFFSFSEEFVFSSNSDFINGESFDSGESISEYNYQLRTPARFIGSIAFLMNQKAAFNFEYEYVDYSSAKLNDSRNFPFDFSAQNKAIEQQLTSTHNVRAGGEYIEGPFVVRAGFRYDSNPYANTVFFKPDESRLTYSFGGGFRSKNYNIDLSYNTFNNSVTEQLYNTAETAAKTEEREHNLVLTLGWRW